MRINNACILRVFWCLSVLAQFSSVFASSGICMLELFYEKDGISNALGAIPCTASSNDRIMLPTRAKGKQMKLLLSNPLDACSTLSSPMSNTEFTLLIERGGCSFQTKILNAEKAGASQVVVLNTPKVVYDQGKRENASSSFDCEQSEAWASDNSSVWGDAESSKLCVSNCDSGLCILTGKTNKKKYQICCIVEREITMTTDKQFPQPSIPSVFVTTKFTQILEDLVGTLSLVKTLIFYEEEPSWNAVMFVTWAVAVITVVIGASFSASKERMHSRQVVLANYGLGESNSHNGCYSAIHDENEEERLILTPRHAISFVLMGSLMLILLFYVNLLFFVNLIFMISGIICFSTLVVYPICIYIFPKADEMGFQLPFQNFLSYSIIFSFTPSIALGVWWFVERNSPNMWIIQDIFCICLCIIFIDTIHISSLRVATILLTVAFCYDIFFVYLSPYIFGSNVMITVASGGGNSKLTNQEFCDLHPTDPSCSHGENMPLVLRFPLINSFYGGYSMLGLGDIVLPGILVSFALRYDYCKGYPISRNYFLLISIAYAIGLMVANIMTVELRKYVAGQPALMYLVPCTLGTFLFEAWRREEFEDLWNGPACMNFAIQEQPPNKSDSKTSALA